MDLKFTTKLSPVEPGQVITVHGRSSASAKIFVVELSEDDVRDDIAFYFAARFAGYFDVVRTSRTKGSWKHNEKTENLVQDNVYNPLNKGADFKISIFVDFKKFFVMIDDKPFCTFLIRKDLKDIKRLNVLYDVDKVYQVEQALAKPRKWPANVDTKIKVSVPTKFKIGGVVVIKGVTRSSDCGSFVASIRDNELRVIEVEVNLELQTVAINSQTDSYSWIRGEPLELVRFPFNKGETFKITFKIRDAFFEVAVNDFVIGELMLGGDVEDTLSRIHDIEVISRGGAIVTVYRVDHYQTADDCPDCEPTTPKIIDSVPTTPKVSECDPTTPGLIDYDLLYETAAVK